MFPIQKNIRTDMVRMNSCTANRICFSLGSANILTFEPTSQEFPATVKVGQGYAFRDQSAVEELEKMPFSSRHRLLHRSTRLEYAYCFSKNTCIYVPTNVTDFCGARMFRGTKEKEVLRCVCA